MDDRERLEAIVKVVRQYLPPDGIYGKEAMGKIIELVDPLPPKREWVGLTRDEVLDIEETTKHPLGFYQVIEAKLKEKNA